MEKINMVFGVIRQAYDTLSDAKERKEYDRQLLDQYRQGAHHHLHNHHQNNWRGRRSRGSHGGGGGSKQRGSRGGGGGGGYYNSHGTYCYDTF